MAHEQLNALVVDDEVIARKAVGFALENEGFDCTYASDGCEALEHMAFGEFDLLVTDLRMPNKHGHALAVECLSTPQPPVIVVHTSVDDPRLTKDLMLKGVDDVIYKPTTYAAFAAKIVALVRRRKLASHSKSVIERDGTSHESEATPNKHSATTSCPLRPIGQAEYERRLANVQYLLPLSAAAYEVFVQAHAEDTSVDALVTAMLKDAALTADVLRLANSACYRRNQSSIIDIKEAVARLGFKKVGEIALALNAMSAFRSCIVPWIDAELGQDRSVAASLALERLFHICDWNATDDGMTLSAYLHPLGRLLLGSAFQGEYTKLLDYCEQNSQSLRSLESQVFPETHYAALARVLSRWNIPDAIWTPLCHVGDPYDVVSRLQEPLRSQVELIKIAVFVGQIAAGRWMPWDLFEPPPASLLRRYRVEVDSLIEQTRTDLAKISGRNSAHVGARSAGASGGVDKNATLHVMLHNLSYRRNSWMPLFLQTLGFEPLQGDSNSPRQHSCELVDCLGAAENDIVDKVSLRQWHESHALFLIRDKTQITPRISNQAVLVPTSISALQAAIIQNARVPSRQCSTVSD